MISGHTRVLAVVGDPITAARAPQSLNEALHARGLDAVAIPAGVPREALAAFVDGVRGWDNLCGLVVTMPHKPAIARLTDNLTPNSLATGTVNVVRRDADGTLTGDQIDGEGFIASLTRNGIDTVGSRVLLLGAGGVARSIAFALAAEGPTRLAIANRSEQRARDLVLDLRAAFPRVDIGFCEPAAAKDADIIINATSVGSAANPGLPLEPHVIPSDAIVADVVAIPERTALLHAADARGARTQSGVLMQEAQLDHLVDFLL
ncbi:shikimate dehydrogenase family protein [Paramicrobacterium chengjingii]|uniref:shikimate dehydrogenase family protein n=1 Tax=Paramicrobacterium chengjingii TaxID=2769067 RepID=UPI00142421BC|nr:shikimate dehydrogenase [Microbacterium chengjingii]